jgi:hypothetical protein
MKRIRTILIFLLGFNCILYGQRKIELTPADRTILGIPDSLTNSSQSIANYINSNFSSPEKKLRAIYIWVAENIQYDTESMYNFSHNTCEAVSKTLITRKGVCQDYAELFNNIANKVGVKSYVIKGYTKQFHEVNYNPHAWCAAMIDSDWFIFDPTWGSGFVQDSEYNKKLNDEYYKLLPKESINSHMPFDPLWQFLNFPITNVEFCNGRLKDEKVKVFFNYIDTLKVYEEQSESDRLISSIMRIENNGINSFFIYTIIQNLQEKYKNDYYNRIVEKYDEGIYLLNKFIDYRNNQFKPYIGDACLQQKLDSVETSFNQAIKYIETIKHPDQKIKTSLYNTRKSIEAALVNLNEQKKFLAKYLNTYINYRKSLFYDKM